MYNDKRYYEEDNNYEYDYDGNAYGDIPTDILEAWKEARGIEKGALYEEYC